MEQTSTLAAGHIFRVRFYAGLVQGWRPPAARAGVENGRRATGKRGRIIGVKRAARQAVEQTRRCDDLICGQRSDSQWPRSDYRLRPIRDRAGGSD